jgi:alcohol dehydrogenase class IV
MTRLAAWLGLPSPSFEAVMRWVLDLRRRIGIPHTLAEIGVQEEHAKPFAPQAHMDPSTGGNPLSLTATDFERLYLKCIRGELGSY